MYTVYAACLICAIDPKCTMYLLCADGAREIMRRIALRRKQVWRTRCAQCTRWHNVCGVRDARGVFDVHGCTTTYAVCAMLVACAMQGCTTTYAVCAMIAACAIYKVAQQRMRYARCSRRVRLARHGRNLARVHVNLRTLRTKSLMVCERIKCSRGYVCIVHKVMCTCGFMCVHTQVIPEIENSVLKAGKNTPLDGVLRTIFITTDLYT